MPSRDGLKTFFSPSKVNTGNNQNSRNITPRDEKEKDKDEAKSHKFNFYGFK